MNGLTTVTTNGQVTIPGFVRKALGVKVGDKVYFSKVYNDKKQILIKIIPKNVVDKLFGSLGSEKKFVSLKDVREKSVKKLARKYGLE